MPGITDMHCHVLPGLDDGPKRMEDSLAILKEAERQVQAQFERGEVSEEQIRALKREIIATEKRLNGYEKAARETRNGTFVLPTLRSTLVSTVARSVNRKVGRDQSR